MGIREHIFSALETMVDVWFYSEGDVKPLEDLSKGVTRFMSDSFVKNRL